MGLLPFIFVLTPLHIADNSLTTFVDVNVFNVDPLLGSITILLQGVHLRREGPIKPIECPLRTVLLRDVINVSKPSGKVSIGRGDVFQAQRSQIF